MQVEENIKKISNQSEQIDSLIKEFQNNHDVGLGSVEKRNEAFKMMKNRDYLNPKACQYRKAVVNDNKGE